MRTVKIFDANIATIHHAKDLALPASSECTVCKISIMQLAAVEWLDYLESYAAQTRLNRTYVA